MRVIALNEILGTRNKCNSFYLFLYIPKLQVFTVNFKWYVDLIESRYY